MRALVRVNVRSKDDRYNGLPWEEVNDLAPGVTPHYMEIASPKSDRNLLTLSISSS